MGARALSHSGLGVAIFCTGAIWTSSMASLIVAAVQWRRARRMKLSRGTLPPKQRKRRMHDEELDDAGAGSVRGMFGRWAIAPYVSHGERYAEIRRRLCFIAREVGEQSARQRD